MTDERDPITPGPGQIWKDQDGIRWHLRATTDDGYAILEALESRHGNQPAIIREFWELHERFDCVSETTPC